MYNMTIMDKTTLMREIRDELVNAHESPLYAFRTEHNYFPVIGEGSHTAKIVFIGEAPGKNEALKARPFCGAAGKLLDKMLESIELDRSSVYITNIVKDRPPENRDPTMDEIEFYAPFLIRQLEIIQPAVIVTLGRFSTRFILEQFESPEQFEPIGKLHGRKIATQAAYGPITIIPQYHPAAALYNGGMREQLFADFAVIREVV
jgi:DNA polymerase